MCSRRGATHISILIFGRAAQLVDVGVADVAAQLCTAKGRDIEVGFLDVDVGALLLLLRRGHGQEERKHHAGRRWATTRAAKIGRSGRSYMPFMPPRLDLT